MNKQFALVAVFVSLVCGCAVGPFYGASPSPSAEPTGSAEPSAQPSKSAEPSQSSELSAQPSPPDQPTPSTEPSPTIPPHAFAVVRIEQVGGFIPQEITLRHYPTAILYADGRLITQGAQIMIYPGPALPSLIETRLTEAGVAQVLDWARAAGLVGPDRLIGQIVPDVGVTQFTIQYPRGTSNSTSMAPIFDPASPDPDRAAVEEFQSKLLNVRAEIPDEVIGDDAPYNWDSLRVISYPANLQGIPDSPMATVKDWPLESLATFGDTMPVGDNFRCGAVRGDDLATLRPMIDSSNELTLWRSDDHLYQLILHPLLPDDPDCPAFDV